MRKSRSDYAFIAAICAAAHSTNVTCARPFNVLKFLGLRLSCFRALTDVLFSLFVPSALRGVQHVTICTFQFCISFVSDLLSSSSWNVSLVLGPKNWYGLGSARSGLPSSSSSSSSRSSSSSSSSGGSGRQRITSSSSHNSSSSSDTNRAPHPGRLMEAVFPVVVVQQTCNLICPHVSANGSRQDPHDNNTLNPKQGTPSF